MTAGTTLWACAAAVGRGSCTAIRAGTAVDVCTIRTTCGTAVAGRTANRTAGRASATTEGTRRERDRGARGDVHIVANDELRTVAARRREDIRREQIQVTVDSVRSDTARGTRVADRDTVDARGGRTIDGTGAGVKSDGRRLRPSRHTEGEHAEACSDHARLGKDSSYVPDH